jgi:hypothetical protein
MTTTIQDFVKSAGLSMTAAWTDTNPNMPNRDMDHWRCTLKAGRSRMTIVYSMGSGHNGAEPKLCEVLDCLASDSHSLPLPEMAGSEEEAFTEWCSEFGYDTDSRQHLRTYRACLSQSRRLRKLLGAAFTTLLSDVERL